MTLTISVAGAKADEIRRGVAAAQKVFDEVGVTAEEVARARMEVDVWDMDGFPDPPPNAALSIMELWDLADDAALAACCAGWRRAKWPRTADLALSESGTRH